MADLMWQKAINMYTAISAVRQPRLFSLDASSTTTFTQQTFYTGPHSPGPSPPTIRRFHPCTTRGIGVKGSGLDMAAGGPR